MPYRLEGNCVQVQHAEGWINVAGGCHSTRDEALAHLQALQANVPEAHKSKKVGDKSKKP